MQRPEKQTPKRSSSHFIVPSPFWTSPRLATLLLSCCVAACTITGGDSNQPDADSPSSEAPPTQPASNTAPQVQFTLTALQTNEDEALSASGSATDAEGDAITLSVETQPAHGLLVATLVGQTITITYTPEPNYNGPDALAFIATDARGASSARVLVPITVLPVDDPLLVADDDVTATEDAPATFTNLLNNDADADQSEPLAITAVDMSSAEGATLALDQAGAITYTPAPAFNALSPGQTVSDSFHYTVTNASGATGQGTVHVIVSGANDAPVLDAPTLSSVTCQPHQSLTPQALTFSDDDNGQTHVFARAGGDCPATFAIAVSGSISGECPAVGADCTATFSVSDGDATDTVDITLTANTVFVAPSGTGDGTSWANATGDLQSAFDTARPAGKAVWIKQGTFAPSGELTLVQQDAPVQTPPAFHIVGSFAGTESLLSQRGPPTQWTRLEGSRTHRILRTRFAYLDMNGLLFQHGQDTDSGAGIYAFAGELTLTDLGFLENFVNELGDIDAFGGAVTFDGGLGTIEHCDFAFNGAGNAFPSGSAAGGAIAMLNAASVNISNSTFVSNSLSPGEGSAGATQADGGDGGSARGGAIYNDGGSFFIDHTTFLFNEAFGAWGGNGGNGGGGGPGGNGGKGGDAFGGAIYTIGEQFILSHTRFIINTATAGRGGDGGSGEDSSTGSGTNGGHGGKSGDARGAAMDVDTTLASVTIFDSAFNGNQTGFAKGFDEFSAGGNGGNGGAGVVAGGQGGHGGVGGNVAGGAVHARMIGNLRMANVQFVDNTAYGLRGGIGGNGGEGGSSSGGDAGNGGDAGLCSGGAAQFEAVAAATSIKLNHTSFYGNVAVAGSLIASAGTPGAGGADGATGVVGDASGGALVATAATGNLALSNSALYGNVTHNAAGDTVSDIFGAVSVIGSCAEEAVSGAVSLTSNPFATPLPASKELFLTASNPCIDAASEAIDTTADYVWDDKTVLTSNVLDTGAPDAGIHFSTENGFITSISQSNHSPVTYSAANVTSCEAHEYSYDTINRIIDANTGTITPTQYGWAMLLVCGNSSAEVNVAP